MDSMVNRSCRIKPCKAARGLSLVELMIALLLGLLLVGGIIHVFSSSQQTNRTRNQLDGAQESLRFAAETITRIVRQGDAIDSASDANTLRVRYTGGTGTRDCLGQATSGTVIDEFKWVDGEIRCTTTNGPAAGNETTLLTGVDTFGLRYGADTDGDDRISDAAGSSEYVATPADWDAVRSVKVSLGMDLTPTTHLPAVDFIATMRPAMVAMASGGSGGAGSGESEGGGSDEGSGGDDPGGADGTGDGDGTGSDDSSGDGNDNGNGDGSGTPPDSEPDPDPTPEPPSFVQCNCKRNGASTNASRTGSNPSACTDDCCTESLSCSGNNCTFIAWCPAN